MLIVKRMEKEEKMEKQQLDVDLMLKHVGEFSTYQCLVIFLACIMIFPQSFPNLIMYFGALNPPWQCMDNATSCLINGTQSYENEYRCTVPRNEWRYTEQKSYSIVTQFDLVCETSWLIYTTTSIYFIGWILGAIIIGWAADKYGRKLVLFPCTAILIGTVFISAFSPNIYLFICLRFIAGFAKSGTSLQSFIIISELVREKFRPGAGITLWIFFAFAMCLMGLKAYFIREWKTLFIVCSAPYIFVILFYKFIPESLRWQRLNDQKDKAMITFHKMAKVNNKTIPPNVELSTEKEESVNKNKMNIFKLFDSRKLAIYSLVQGYSWVAFGMVYYGLSFAAKDLGGNLYSNYVLVSAVEIPACMIAIYICERFGRKKSIIISNFIASIALIIIAFIITNKEARIARITLAMIGKLCNAIAFDGIYTWSLEIYPTSVRAEGMGYLQVMSRIGAASSPWVAQGLRKLHPSAPFVLMGAAGILISVLCLLLPETKGKPTNETKDDLKLNKTYNVEEEKILGQK